MTTFLDAFALVALLRDEPAANEVETILRRDGCAMTAINLAEVLDVLQRVDGIEQQELEALTGALVAERIELMPIDEAIARGTADVRARLYHRTRAPLSLADCALIAVAARTPDATVATADQALAAAAREEGVAVVPLPDSRGRRP